jgi:hypothetical protein
MMDLAEKAAVIDRICRMERYFDRVQEAAKDGAALETPAVREMLEDLIRYYENGQWLADYRLDEEGGLPTELKRGVLSQDGLYDLLSGLERQN